MNIIINQLLIFLKKKTVKKRLKFSIINECKKFLKDLSEEIIQEIINENSISVKEIDDNNDKIYIKNQENRRYWNWRRFKKEKTELICSKSTRKPNKFKFRIKIPNTAFQLENLKPEKPVEKKGVIEYKYKIKMIEKYDENEDEF